MSEDVCYVIAGGTMTHVAPHFALAAPAYGAVGRALSERLRVWAPERRRPWRVQSVQTRMAGAPDEAQRALESAAGIERLETNEDLERLLGWLVAQPSTRGIVLAAAVCDFEPAGLEAAGEETERFGKDQPRLQSRAGEVVLRLRAAPKLVGRLRAERKDIFVVSFKTTAGVSREACYAAGLRALKRSSSNLVLANDVRRHHNVVVTPEEYPYWAETRGEALEVLAELITRRSGLSFVRTDVREGARADARALAAAGCAPANFVEVLAGLIAAGAYRPLDGKTTGHFGCKVWGQPFAALSSCRKEDHNQALERGLAKIYGVRAGRIQAEGGRPSVGEHTQQRIYRELGERAHAIVHAHVPLRARPGREIPRRAQFAFECGSVECAENAASGLAEVAPGIFAVHLEGHGPNVAFHRDVPATQVLDLLEACWDLGSKTGGEIIP